MLTQGVLDLAGEWHLRNSKFHDCLVQNCRSDWLIGFRHLLHEHSTLYLRLALLKNRKHRDVRKEHAAIFESAIEGDIDLCTKLVEQHIEASVADVVAYLPRSAEEFAQTIVARNGKTHELAASP